MGAFAKCLWHLWWGGSVPNASALTTHSRGTSLAAPNPPLNSDVRCSMTSLKHFLSGVMLVGSLASSAQAQDFTGEWSIDLRSKQEKQQKAECGEASFSLKQDGDQITGSHQFYTVGCGRLNEGGLDSVHGIAIGNTAFSVQPFPTVAANASATEKHPKLLNWCST